MSHEGYLHPLYAESFAEIGTPVYLPRSGGWLVRRAIPGTPYDDAMGTYPMFFCENWAALIEDIEALKDVLVSLLLVISPLSNFPTADFQDYFEICKPYKDHFILDLSSPLRGSISDNKRKLARRALHRLEVHLDTAPSKYLDEWDQLYACLIRRHNIQGLRAFSRQSFAHQLAIPNTHYFRVLQQGRCVGGNLYYVQGDTAYAHLSAFTDEGYAAGAPYAVKWAAIRYFSRFLKWVNFGGGTAGSKDPRNGLELFKQGWSNITKQAYLCGKILNPGVYAELREKSGSQDSAWFPAYRAGEF